MNNHSALILIYGTGRKTEGIIFDLYLNKIVRRKTFGPGNVISLGLIGAHSLFNAILKDLSSDLDLDQAFLVISCAGTCSDAGRKIVKEAIDSTDFHNSELLILSEAELALAHCNFNP